MPVRGDEAGEVSIRPRPLAGGIGSSGRTVLTSSSFNPPPARWPGESRDARLLRLRQHVSIRPRPAGRGNPHQRGQIRPATEFQSAPGRWPGESRRRAPSVGSPWGFNPPPARWPGESPLDPGRRPVQQGFNPPPARWPGESAGGWGDPNRIEVVSIRPRPAGRGNRVRSCSPAITAASFNPPPARWPGETAPRPARHRGRGRFQSAPGRWPGESPGRTATSCAAWTFQSAPGRWPGESVLVRGFTRISTSFNPPPAAGRGNLVSNVAKATLRAVSIRPRPLAGGIVACYRTSPMVHFQFQSAPGRWPGESHPRIAVPLAFQRFNPPPARWPGETGRPQPRGARGRVFQSAPGRWPGESRPPQSAAVDHSSFNPPPAAGRGNPPADAGTARGEWFQSAPGPLAGGIRCTIPGQR